MRPFLTWLAACQLILIPAHAQPVGATTLTYIPGTSVKLEQIIGDCDYQVQAQKGICQPATIYSQ